MLTGDYEKDKEELERLIEHEKGILMLYGKLVGVAQASLSSYRRQLQALEWESSR